MIVTARNIGKESQEAVLKSQEEIRAERSSETVVYRKY